MIYKIREIVPDITITTDILVGFPGEKEVDFLKTVDLVKKIRFDYAFMFRYSPMDNTLSSLLEGDIEDDEKKRRLKEIIKIQYDITKEKAKEMIGKKERCIAINNAKRGGILCKSFRGKSVVINEDVNLGDEMLVEIVEVKGNTLIGKIIKKEE